MNMFLKQVRTRPYLILLLFIFVVMLFTSLKKGPSQARASRQFDPGTVKSFVPKLKVVDVHVEDGALSLTLRNDYNKTITAFAVSSSRITTRSELIDSDQVFAPKTTKTKLYELPSSLLPEYDTTLQAVVLDDGTVDGNANIIRQILDARAANKKQIDRILPTLVLDTRNRDLKQQFQEIRSKISELPNEEAEKSFEFNAALQDAKNLAAITIDELEQIQQKHGDDAARQRLANIKESYKVKSSKAQGALHRSQ